MAHTRAWNESTPANSDIANQLDTFIQQFKADVRERLELEHYFNTETNDTLATGDGRHKPGLTSCMYEGTTANITANLTTPKLGCITGNTSKNTVQRYNGSAWEDIGTYKGGASFFVELSSDQTGVDMDERIEFDNTVWDSIPNWNASHYWVVPVTGIYLITGRISVKQPVEPSKNVTMEVWNGTPGSANRILLGSFHRPDTSFADVGSVVSGLVSLTAADEISAGYTAASSGNSFTLQGSSDGQTYLAGVWLGAL